jgi:cystathionine beta-lyase
MSVFDRSIERRGTASYKWDGAEALFGRDVLPFWVADMDFPAPESVLAAVRRRARHPVFGYEAKGGAIAESVRHWIAVRHGWDVPSEWLMFCPPSTIVGMIGLVTRLVEPAASVACHAPGYSPLFRLVEDNGRRLLRCPLVERRGRFHLDADDLRQRLHDDVRMLLLCNPHNPTGRVFTETELRAVSEVASEKGLVVVSDEVHCDLVMPGHRHIPFGQLGGERTVTVVSPNKTFNTAGMPQSTFIIPDPAVRAIFAGFLDTMQLNHESTFGAVAADAAYRHGADWLDALIPYLDGNHRLLRVFLEEHLPSVRVSPAEGTYLAWLDCRATGLAEDELMRRLVETGGVGLYPGTAFGEEGRGFLRMNIACPRELLRRGLEGLARALG